MLDRVFDRYRNRANVYLIDPDYNFDNKRLIIDRTIELIKTVIAHFEGPETDSAYKRDILRIIHIMERVKTIVLPGKDDARANEIKIYENKFIVGSFAGRKTC